MINKVSTRIPGLNVASTQQQTKTQTQKTEKLSRVEEIKKAIENGTYKVDIENTAKAMAKSLL
ncbi:flagellar biosynthesis anti-sigma factor FlgM [Caminibacter sp.]